jgi:hypothetical protein
MPAKIGIQREDTQVRPDGEKPGFLPCEFAQDRAARE